MRKMKDSGIEWIGEIPESWNIARVKNLYSFQTGWTPSTGNAAYFDGDIPWANISDIGTEKVIYDTAKHITEEAVEVSSMDLTPKGSLMYSFKLSVGNVSFCGRDMYTNEAIASFLPNSDNDLRYLYYAAPIFIIKNANENIYGAKLLNQDLIKNATVLKLPLAEQIRIADYLDKKCAEIDAIIAAKEKTNELLKERRQSIIYEAVTKGLDPTVPMKDSGVEWIGMIPESWNVWRLKHLLCQEKGAIKAGPFGSSITANDMQGGDVKVFTQRTVLDNDFLSGDEYISFDKYEDLKGFSVKTGDILITTRGTIGKTAIVPKSSFGILHPCLIKMSIDSDKINKSLLCRIFNETNIFEEQLRLASNATTIDVIYTQNLLNIFVPLAPLHEQDRICKYLNEKCESLDYLISSNDSTIKKLKEYRQSVIYEAVTGKVEVQ
jgi:type I restriction enzyme S subunit